MAGNNDIMAPLVSIVLPLYNAEETIHNTIQSVFTQTYNNWELIVVDDCSTDSSVEIVKKYGTRITLIEMKVNSGGPARPRNIGVRKSKGRYIAFLDSDDIWYKNKLEVCSKFFNSKVDLIYHDLKIVGDDGSLNTTIMKGRCLSKTPIKDLLVDGNIINNSSVVVKRDIMVKVGDINESPSVIAAEDYELWLRISEISNKLYYIPAVLGEYYIGCENISNKNMSVCAENASKRFVEHLDNNELVKYKARIKYLNGRYMYLDRNYIEARYELMEVVKSGKFMLKIKSIYMICVMLFLSAFK